MSGMLSTARGTRLEAFGPVEWGLLASIALMWGSSFLFIAESLESYEPGVITTVRLGLGAATLALVPAARRPIRSEDWRPITVLAVFWMAVPFVLFPVAQQWIDSSLTGMLNGAMPLFAALVAAILLRRLPRHLQAIGLILGFTGVTVVFWPSLGESSSSLVGASLIIAATACYGVAVNLAVPLQQRYGSLPVLLRALAISVVMTAPFALVGIPGTVDGGVTLSGTVSLVVLGVFGSGIAFVAMATLVGRAGATRGAIAVYFIPIVAMALGVVFRDETIPLASYGGIALVLLGAWLTSRREV